MGVAKERESCDQKFLEEDEEECCDGKEGGGSAPDGGWGWMVMLAALGCITVVDGISYSFLPIMQELRVEFDGESDYTLAWIGSALPGTYLLVGPFVSALCVRYGCRRVTMTGSVIAAFAFWAATQSPNIEFFIMTYSILGGIGFGMIYLPSIVSVGYWFDKKRAFATGLALCGSGVGTFLFPPLLNYLQSIYTWQGIILILAGIVCNCAVCGAMFFSHQKPEPANSCKACPHHVEIERGAIMKALIEEKKRQRTISNGSLDNCVITQQNTLIKLDKKLFEMKRNDSFIARFKRQLGFSSQSLNNSKTSVIPSIVIDAVKQEHNNRTGQNSPIFRGSQNIRVTQLSQASLPKRGSFPDSAICLLRDKEAVHSAASLSHSGSRLPVSKQDLHKTKSCEEGIWMKLPGTSSSVDGGSGGCFSVENSGGLECGSLGNSAASGLECSTSGHGTGSDSGSIVSIQVIPNHLNNSARGIQAMRGLRQRSSHSESSASTAYSMSNKSTMSSCCGSIASVPAMMASVEEVEHEFLARHVSVVGRWGSILLDMVAFRLLADKVFLLFILSSTMTLLAFMSPYMFLPIKATYMGMSYREAQLLVSVIGITNTIGRVLSGWLADRPWVNVFHLNNLSLTVAGFSILLVPLCQTPNMLVVIAAVYGVAIAVFYSLRSILLVELLGLDYLTKSFGVLSLFQGIAAFLGLPITGWLEEKFDLDMAFYISGALLLLSALLMLPIRCLRSDNSEREMEVRQSSRQLPVYSSSLTSCQLKHERV